MDEVFCKVNGKWLYLWRAADYEGVVLEAIVTKRRDRKAALKLLKKLMKHYPESDVIVTDKLGSYDALLRDLGMASKQETARSNNRCAPTYRFDNENGRRWGSDP